MCVQSFFYIALRPVISEVEHAMYIHMGVSLNSQIYCRQQKYPTYFKPMLVGSKYYIIQMIQYLFTWLTLSDLNVTFECQIALMVSITYIPVTCLFAPLSTV